jgi:centromere protein J
LDQEGEEDDFEMKFPERYHNKDAENLEPQDRIVGNDGKIQRMFANGKKEVIFSNGVRRETFPDGYTIVYFNNGDAKQTYPDGKIVYYFAEAKTTQTTYTDGLQVFKFSNTQIEKHFADGTKEIM